jgi:hypothetical protein
MEKITEKNIKNITSIIFSNDEGEVCKYKRVVDTESCYFFKCKKKGAFFGKEIVLFINNFTNKVEIEKFVEGQPQWEKVDCTNFKIKIVEV